MRVPTDILRTCHAEVAAAVHATEAEEMTCEDLDNRQYPSSIKLAQVGQTGR